jgi:DNA-binding winged helix-turn-helix (wHTH) protein
MLKLRDLAVRPDFQVGPMRISASRREITGPAGTIHLQPLVMQAFLLLLDADGEVVTRDQIFDQCWGGVMVGNESLNRVMAMVRQIPSEVAPGLFEIETIPRTGYRLAGDILPLLRPDPKRGAVSRRSLVASSAALASVIGAAGYWWTGRSRSERRFNDLMDSAQGSVRKFEIDGKTIEILEEAVAIQPGSAKAWGLLALARSLLVQDPSSIHGPPPTIPATEEAIGRAFAIDPKEPNALLAMFELQGSTLGWMERDQRLRQIIGIDPRNVLAITELVSFLQATGLNMESWKWNERALAIEPLSADLLGRKALKLWIAGRTNDADKVVDQVRTLYPANPWAWWIQFLILALTDRAPAALGMLKAEPGMLNPPLAALWQACLPALDQRSTENIRIAREACTQAAKEAGELAAHAVMILASLGSVDSAFAIADGFLRWRGAVVSEGQEQSANSSGWRVGVQWLFTPPCANMRADPRFLELCEGIGLTDYWRRRAVTPDFMLTPMS